MRLLYKLRTMATFGVTNTKTKVGHQKKIVMERSNSSLNKSFWSKLKSSLVHHHKNEDNDPMQIEEDQSFCTTTATPTSNFSSRSSSAQSSPASPSVDIMTSNLLCKFKYEEIYCQEIFQLCIEETVYKDYFMKFLEKAYCAESLEFVLQVKKLERLWNVEPESKIQTSSGSFNTLPSGSPPQHSSSLIQRIKDEEQPSKNSNSFQHPLGPKSNSFSQVIVQIPMETKKTGFQIIESIIQVYLMDNSEKQLNLAAHCKNELLSIYRQYSELWKSKVSNVFLFKVLTNLFQLLEQVKDKIIHQLRIEKFPDFLRSDLFNQILKKKNLPSCIKSYSKLRSAEGSKGKNFV